MGNVFKEYSEKNHTELSALTIIQGEGTVKREDSDRNLMYDESNLSNYKMVRKNDFIVHLRSFEGGLEKSSLDGIISPAYHTFHSDVADSRFYYPYFRSHEFIKHKLVPHVYGIRDGRSIDIDGMKTIEIPYTSIDEQRKIGDYLESLDHLITLHQRKILYKHRKSKLVWEQRKLVDYLEVSKNKNKNEAYGKEDVLSVSGEFGIVNQIEFQGRSFAGASVVNYGVVEVGDIVYTKSPLKSNPYGIIKTNKGKSGIVSTLYAVYKPKENCDSEFVQTYFELDSRMNSYMHPLVNKGAKNDMKVSDENALKGSVNFPKFEEQKEISQYFESLNTLITLHHRKPWNLLEIDLFVWEQRKFGDLVEKYEDPVETPTEGYMRLGIRSHAKGTFHSYVEKGKELETAKMFRVAADKFIVNITFGWEHAVAITDENDVGKLVSHRFPQYSFNNGMIPKFFRYLILDEKFKHHLELSSPGGAGRNRVLKLSDMLEYKMNFPCEEEQRKIASYFDDLDHLITLHQRKCDELKNMKKYMLQNMFE